MAVANHVARQQFQSKQGVSAGDFAGHYNIDNIYFKMTFLDVIAGSFAVKSCLHQLRSYAPVSKRRSNILKS